MNAFPDEMVYETKYQYLLEYYKHISQKSYRLRHRIYHVKKEINHLKQLKKLLCERLLLHRAVIIDKNLEIPDNDSNMIDKATLNETIEQPQKSADITGISRKRKSKVGNADEQAKKNIPNKRRKAKDVSNKGGSVVSMVENITQRIVEEDEIQPETKDTDEPTNGETLNQSSEDQKDDGIENITRSKEIVNHDH